MNGTMIASTAKTLIDAEPHSTACNDIDWTERWKQCRAARQQLVDEDSEPSREGHWTQFCHDKDLIRQQLFLACQKDYSDSSGSPIRTALRMAVLYLSIPDADPDLRLHRQRIQQEAYDCWHVELIRFILLGRSSANENETAKPPLPCLAARTLCNCVTQCPTTARHLLDTTLTAPSNSHDAQQPLMYNWVDLLLATTAHRPTLAALVACLHNSLCAVHDVRLFQRMASCPLLVATLLRHLVTSLATSSATVDTAHTDDATDWIQLVVSKLCRVGLLPVVYEAISSHVGPSIVVVPEHVVLLHCVRTTIEATAAAAPTSTGSEESSHTKPHSRCFELGGEGWHETAEATMTPRNNKSQHTSIVETHVFLAALYVSLSVQVDQSRTATQPNNRDAIDAALDTSVIQLALDILAETLTDDSAVAAAVRLALGRTSMIERLVRDMAWLLDTWQAHRAPAVRNQASSLDDKDQCRLTTMVRVLGNLCFECPLNQDRLRHVVVPPLSTTTTTSTRNGLHVLLSTATMSFACFTLREWVVVAIRSALDGNAANQAVVAELEASAAVQSAELHDMGVRVDLNVTRGSVSVTPLEPPPQPDD